MLLFLIFYFFFSVVIVSTIMKWATFTFQKIIMPSMDLHVKYWERKLIFDRFLEKYTYAQNFGMGILLGCTTFLFALPFCASESDRWLLEMLSRTREEAKKNNISHSDYCNELDNRRPALLNAVLHKTAFISVDSKA